MYMNEMLTIYLKKVIKKLMIILTKDINLNYTQTHLKKIL